MKPWLRTDTQDWIKNLENRLEDIDYYLKRTVEWCEIQGVYNNKIVLMACLVTCIWVSSMRNEEISFQEIIELVGLKGMEPMDIDKIYTVSKEFQNLDHKEILEIFIEKTRDWDGYLPS